MKSRTKTVYYFSALLFLIGCVASRASIVNNISPYSTADSNHIALSILLVLITLGLGIFSYFGLVRKNSPNKMPKIVLRFGKVSLIISLMLIALVILLYLWLIFSTPQWGYGLIESSKYVH